MCKKMNEDNENHSLDYIEDPYFNPQDSTLTPSLDEYEDDLDLDLLEKELESFELKSLEFDDSNADVNLQDESVNVEAEFFNVKRANAIIRAFFKKKFIRQVRVTYCDLTKPYAVNMSNQNDFKKFLDLSIDSNEEAGANNFPPDLSHLSEEEKERQHALWTEELTQIEDEISTLRTVLAAKMRRCAELKRNLGITVWKEVSDDINQGIKNVKESNVYQTVETKVGQVTKAVTDAPIYQKLESKIDEVISAVRDAPIYQKTTSLIGGITGNITNKLGQMRHSESFRSIEEKVGTAYENVKTKVVSRSNSNQSLNEDGRSRSGSIVASPTIPEDKPLA